MGKFFEVLGWLVFLGIIGILVLFTVECWNFRFGVQVSSEDTKKLLDALQPKHERLLFMLDEWEQKTASLPVKFSAKRIGMNLQKMHSSEEVSDEEVRRLLKENCQYVEDYEKILEEPEKSEFKNQIFYPIDQDYYLYKINYFLYKKYDHSKNPDDRVVIFKKHFKSALENIEERIVSFARKYDGYFDKEGFLNLINQIKEAKNIDEFYKKMMWLEDATEACIFAYEKGKCDMEWLSINVAILKQRESLESMKNLL